MSDGWEVRPEWISTQTVGESAGMIRKCLRELESVGLAKLERNRNSSGHLSGSSWVIYELPTEIKDNRNSVEPSFGKSQHISKINVLSKNKETYSSEHVLFQTCWDLYGRKGSRQDSEAQWLRLTEDERNKVFSVIPPYVNARPEAFYRKDFQRWLKGKNFNDRIITEPADTLALDKKILPHKVERKAISRCQKCDKKPREIGPFCNSCYHDDR